MRLKFLLLSVLQISIIGFAQDKSFDLLQNQTETQILYNRVVPISKATQPNTENISAIYYRQLFSEISRSDFQQRLPDSKWLKEQGNLGFSQNQVPLSLLVGDFENIEKSSFETGKVNQNASGNFVLNSNPSEVFEKHQVSLMGSLLARAETDHPVFVLKNDLIFNLSNRNISKIEVFDNQWKVIQPDVPFQIYFAENSNQSIKYRITFDNDEAVIQSFGIEIRNKKLASGSGLDTNFAPDEIHTITSTIGFQGYDETEAHQGIGEYEIFLDTVDGILDRPVILIDGFDPGDGRDIDAMYHMLDFGGTGENLADLIRAEGYDVILLNFPVYTRPGTSTVIDGGADYIQRNAMILVELINQINAQKEGNRQNVIIGPSMGGLISRYALKYMEMNGMDHDARLYLSFDSPHLGANVPIGVQHLFNYMAYGPVGDESVQVVVDGMLRSPAAREMLIDHFESHLQAGSEFEFDGSKLLPDGSPGFRDVFQNELDAMGFPENTRNVAIINGAGDGTTNGTPGMTVIDHTFDLTSTQRAIIQLHFTPNAGQTLEVSNFKGQVWVFVWVTIYESMANAQSPSYTAGLDASPGGRFDMTSIAESAPENDMIQEFLDNLQIEYFSFIPALSSMAITSTQNLYDPVESGLNTPFVNYYIPDENQPHIFLDEGNVLFALTEILIPEMGTSDVEISGIKIENPVRDVLRIWTDKEIKNSSIQITDLSGRTVFGKSNVNLNGQTEVPVKLSKGTYIVQISSEKQNLTKKIISL